MAARLLIGLLAVVVLAWVGVLLRNHLLSEAASPLLYDSNMGTREFDRNIAKLEDAELLNPDSGLDLARATYLSVRERRARARDELEALLASEPDNFTAWRLLLGVSRGVDPERAAQARAEIGRLDPLGGR